MEQFFLARFRGFEDGGSDKVGAVPDGVTVIPEPNTMFLALSAAGLAGFWRLRRRVGRAPA